MTLLNHLITKLNPLDDITTTLSSLSGLPEALEQVAVFRETMKTMQDRISNRPGPQPQALPSIDVDQVTKLQETMEEIMKKVDTPSGPSVGLDSGKVFGAITGLKRALVEVKTSTSAGSGGEACGEMKEMRDLVLEMKVEMAGMKDTLANLTQPVPGPAIDHEMISTLRAILERLMLLNHPIQKMSHHPLESSVDRYEPRPGDNKIQRLCTPSEIVAFNPNPGEKDPISSVPSNPYSPTPLPQIKNERQKIPRL
jgi:hypothetical protein